MKRFISSAQQVDSPKNDQMPIRSLVAMASLYLIWWECLRAFTVDVGVSGSNSPASSGVPFDMSVDSLFPALAGWLGLILGCLCLGCWHHRNSQFFESEKFGRILFVVEFMLTILACAAYVVFQDGRLVVCAAFTIASACIAVHIAAIASGLRNAEIREVITVSLCCLLTYGFVCVPVLFFAASCIPSWTLVLGGTLALVGARFMGRRSNALKEKGAGGYTRTLGEYRTPITLFISLFSYGFVFGLIRVLPLSMGYAKDIVVEAEVCAAVIALLVLVVLFYWSPKSVELWSKLRGTVFPLLAIGFTLLSSDLDPRIALMAMEGGQFLAFVFLAAICIDIVQLAFLAPTPVIAKALLWNSLGAVAGALFVLTFGDHRLSDSALSLLAAAVIGLLSIATLWIGSDEQIRKNWGIRRKLSPKQFYDASVRSRCHALAKTHRLTPRETQVIIALAQGRRPAEIQEEEGVTIHTVRAHIQHAYAKLEIHSAAELQALLKTVPIDEMSLCVDGDQSPQREWEAGNDRK